ncbi:hypothetical protein ACJX0J_027628, partial [Zea mays]
PSLGKVNTCRLHAMNVMLGLYNERDAGFEMAFFFLLTGSRETTYYSFISNILSKG